ncbi:hypothetical protein BCV70DRAFT_51083 [Testicularia cyperi]|uniref:Uncharacterized protein n=1 Tax=Testicularia cyperi TaxID=1882483 RepID=A0A317XV52_9BASI|nr:hypothetical protein BCV70DRAFT_51083 [Testicularia cyperi]
MPLGGGIAAVLPRPCQFESCRSRGCHALALTSANRQSDQPSFNPRLPFPPRLNLVVCSSYWKTMSLLSAHPAVWRIQLRSARYPCFVCVCALPVSTSSIATAAARPCL